MAIEDNSQYNTHTETGVWYDHLIPKNETEEGNKAGKAAKQIERKHNHIGETAAHFS